MLARGGRRHNLLDPRIRQAKFWRFSLAPPGTASHIKTFLRTLPSGECLPTLWPGWRQHLWAVHLRRDTPTPSSANALSCHIRFLNRRYFSATKTSIGTAMTCAEKVRIPRKCCVPGLDSADHWDSKVQKLARRPSRKGSPSRRFSTIFVQDSRGGRPTG
jgi:hypothetical protein